MFDLGSVAVNLYQGDDGIWYSNRQSTIDYPESGNAFCYQIEENSYWFNHRNAVILDALRKNPPQGPIFDIGGGNGFVAQAIQNANYTVALIEPGREGVRNARERGINTIICAALEDIGFKEQSLAAVGLFDVLEHIEDDVTFLKTIRQLLQPGGLVYLTVPAYHFLWSIEDEYAQHYRRYSCSQLQRRFQQAGFNVILSTYFFSFLPLPIYLVRTLPSKLGLRKDGDTQFTAAELRPPSGLTNRVINGVLRFELAAFRRGRHIPFGGSCLVVASA